MPVSKLVFTFPLFPKQSKYLTSIQIVQNPDKNAYTITYYIGLNKTTYHFMEMRSSITWPTGNACSDQRDNGNRPGPLRDEHVSLRHNDISETNNTHYHEKYKYPITLVQLREYMDDFYHVQDEFLQKQAILKKQAEVFMLSGIDPSNFMDLIMVLEFNKYPFLTKEVGEEIINAYQEFLERKLFCACALGNIDDVHYLLSLGVSVNCQDNMGRTPLHYAVMRNELILNKYPDDVKDINVCMRNHPVVVRILLCDYGADFQVKNNNKKTPMDLIQCEIISGNDLDRQTAQAIFDALPVAESSAETRAEVRTDSTLSRVGSSASRGDHLRSTVLASLGIFREAAPAVSSAAPAPC